jgi:hypothetical protein
MDPTGDLYAQQSVVPKRGGAPSLSPDQPVLHGRRRATFLHLSRGAAIIRYWGDSHAVSVPLEALSLPPPATRSRRPPAAHDEPLTRDPAPREH